MTDPSKHKLDDLQQRLDKSLRARRGGDETDMQAETSAASLAGRMVIELAVALAVCMGLGWAADRWLGTGPWLMLAVGMPLGIAAGVVNVMRLSNSKEAKQLFGEGKPIPPSVKDDDED